MSGHDTCEPLWNAVNQSRQIHVLVYVYYQMKIKRARYD